MLAIVAVVIGGLTAKYPGAAVACQSFPLCGANPTSVHGAVHVQLTHRMLAVLLVLHLFGMVMVLRKRRDESAGRAARRGDRVRRSVCCSSSSRRR